jgi:hypothetical protein
LSDAVESLDCAAVVAESAITQIPHKDGDLPGSHVVADGVAVMEEEVAASIVGVVAVLAQSRGRHCCSLDHFLGDAKKFCLKLRLLQREAEEALSHCVGDKMEVTGGPHLSSSWTHFNSATRALSMLFRACAGMVDQRHQQRVDFATVVGVARSSALKSDSQFAERVALLFDPTAAGHAASGSWAAAASVITTAAHEYAAGHCPQFEGIQDELIQAQRANKYVA